ncbi:MAG TPA: glycosyltransferase family 2 protein [Anaerolineaceae bacterium]|nr:glycosyltransferase family 2 protein [Anaerolineaceae bacterium]
MSDFPLFTVVTPSYNQAQFLEQTMLSVLNQDYPNLEYIVVDGASSDGSQEIIRKYADRLAWWVSEKDHGQGEAINKGFASAAGEFIAWLNSDDVYQPGALSAAAEALQAHPEAAFVYSDVLAIDGENRVLNLMHYGNWSLDDLMTFHIIGQPGVFMRRSVLEKAGFLDPNYHYVLDVHLWLRMAQIAPIVHIPGILAAGRFHTLAKNIAAAPRFGEESLKLVTWMQSQPGLAERYERNKRRIWAGAYRMNGRYQLDGGKAWPAIDSYARSFTNHPPTALSEWHRMVYALLCLVGLDRLKPVYYRLRHALRAGSLPQLQEFNPPKK